MVSESTIDLPLLFHALVVLTIGLLSGAPMGVAINRGSSEDKVRAWRVAHSGLSMGGIMLIAFSIVLGDLQLTGFSRYSVLIPAIASGYGFGIGLPFGATTGYRGLKLEGPWQNLIVYVGNIVGAWGSLVATLALLGTTVIAMFTG